ncbi:MAG: hypothetical protein AVDCRST_MAG18-126, partial [uncultured Thermomicrobiales bacterium]
WSCTTGGHRRSWPYFVAKQGWRRARCRKKGARAPGGPTNPTTRTVPGRGSATRSSPRSRPIPQSPRRSHRPRGDRATAPDLTAATTVRWSTSAPTSRRVRIRVPLAHRLD